MPPFTTGKRRARFSEPGCVSATVANSDWKQCMRIIRLSSFILFSCWARKGPLVVPLAFSAHFTPMAELQFAAMSNPYQAPCGSD